MDTFYEYKKVSQKEKDIKRRLFCKKGDELYVWYNLSQEIVGFQYCNNDIAVTFSQNEFSIHRIDSGSKDRLTPILVDSAVFDLNYIKTQIEQYGTAIDQEIKEFIFKRIDQKSS